eukprot:6199969-Pleurochrysis_carterae.AAC.2
MCERERAAFGSHLVVELRRVEGELVAVHDEDRAVGERVLLVAAALDQPHRRLLGGGDNRRHAAVLATAVLRVVAVAALAENGEELAAKGAHLARGHLDLHDLCVPQAAVVGDALRVVVAHATAVAQLRAPRVCAQACRALKRYGKKGAA